LQDHFPARHEGRHHQRRARRRGGGQQRSPSARRSGHPQRSGEACPHLGGHGLKCRRRWREVERGHQRGRRRRCGAEEEGDVGRHSYWLLGVLKLHGQTLGPSGGIGVLVGDLRVLSSSPFSFSSGERVHGQGTNPPKVARVGSSRGLWRRPLIGKA
jgi:hypothetical protein